MGGVVLVALIAGLLAATWYRTLEEGEQEADERGFEQIAVLLVRRIEREGNLDTRTIIEDFDAAVSAHIAVVQDGQTLLSASAPVAVRPVVQAFREPDPLRVRRRVARIGGVSYELFGGATTTGTRAYVVRRVTPPERASTLVPVLAVGWAVAVASAAIIALGVARRREAGLRRARERERHLTSAIAHDLRTPLTSVLTAAALLEAHADRLPEEARRPAAVLALELQRLRILVEDLLELARLEAGDHEMHVEAVTLAGVVQDVIEARSWERVVRTELDPDAAAAVDRLSISRVILNLVDNALRHGGGQVLIRVCRRGRHAVLEVSDGGTSTSPELIQRLLDGEVTDRPAGGRPGLGLQIAQENAALHGSRIEVTLDPDEGTMLTMTLPSIAPIQSARNDRG